ncbi:hypothetical protein SEPCBS119000_003073 [Sporothrix epigloea]|uniref:Zn(2)-C6 fungal-type domain-containing protein n=1 Tax=Sporothrix epigloea TaxID=1892477 RepID=A0ABP0DLL3_9PEZI
MSVHNSPSSFVSYDPMPSDDESWKFMDFPNSGSQTGSPSFAFLHSPASGSLSSYGVVAHVGRNGRGLSSSPGSGVFHYNFSPEPLALPRPPTSLPAQQASASDRQPRLDFPRADQLAGLLPSQCTEQDIFPLDTSMVALEASAFAADQYALAHADAAAFQEAQNTTLSDQQIADLTRFDSASLLSHALQAGIISTPQQQQQQQAASGTPNYFESGANAPSWNSTSVPELQQTSFVPTDSSASGSLLPGNAHAAMTATSANSPLSSPHLHQNDQSDVGLLNQQKHELWTLQEQLELQQLQQLLQLQQAQQSQEARQAQQSQEARQSAQQLQKLWAQQAHQLQPLHPPPMLPSSHGSARSMALTSCETASEESKVLPLHIPSKPILPRVGQGSTSINKVRGPSTRVTKKKATSFSSDKQQLSSSVESSSGDDRFVIFTPKSISTHAVSGGRFNPFECFEALSTTQKGRKGPLAEEVKENALQVRRAGACFCCHSRKVKCDAQLPCKNCVKLANHMPQAICWRFDDFLGPLFPALIRSHFRKDIMASFINDNIDSFQEDMSHTIYLSSGLGFEAKLEIRNVRIFLPAHALSVLKHAHLQSANNMLQVSLENSLPVALDLTENSAVAAFTQQEKIKKALRTYVDAILKEDTYINTVTEHLRSSELPKKILAITRSFYLKTNSPIVKQALSIYTMQYMMMHHLVITDQSLKDLLRTGHIFSTSSNQTSRLLNRQIKAILDELMQEEVDKLFRMFARELKPKARMAWATCLAAFLVFCLFMEATGLSIDYFVITENQIDVDNKLRMNPSSSRAVSVKLSRELENLPFRQFALQFHNIYQTHQLAPTSIVSSSTAASSSTSSPSSTGSNLASALTGGAATPVKASFNPLVDDAPLLAGDLDKHARELVTQLRALLSGDSWAELDFLTFDLLIDSVDSHPYPRDISLNYTGRLCSKFLLSFQNQSYIFTPA